MLRLLRHYFYFVPAQLSKAKGIGKNILLKLQGDAANLLI